MTQKILDRSRLINRIRDVVSESQAAHMTCFNATSLERALSLQLNIPLYAANPALAHLGSKSGGREIFREAGIKIAEGFENLEDDYDIVEALTKLKKQKPALRRAVIKLNEGFSGNGNALFSYADCPESAIKNWIGAQLPQRIKFEALNESWNQYKYKFAQMKGIVEAFVEGDEKRSPSVQCRITPLGEAITISTHDQVMGGPSGQIFQGCTFPADSAYRMEIQEAGQRVAQLLKQRGVLGRFSIDFISVKQAEGWDHYAIEINLRKGGTTHPFIMLQFLNGWCV